MELIEKKIENYAVVFNVNLIRATLNEATDFRDYIDEAIHETDKDIIVNLSTCEHLDSTFLGVLVSSYKKLKMQNRTLVIIEPVDQSSIFLTLNSIGKIFPLYTSVKVALEDIENKRLLEKEISELKDDRVNKLHSNHKAAYNISARPLVDSNNDFPAEETEQTDINVEINNNSESHYKEDQPIKNVEEKQGMFTDSSENKMITESHEKSETDKLSSITGSFSSSNTKNNRRILSNLEMQQIISPERKFSNGTISWEFGFN